MRIFLYVAKYGPHIIDCLRADLTFFFLISAFSAQNCKRRSIWRLSPDIHILTSGSSSKDVKSLSFSNLAFCESKKCFKLFFRESNLDFFTAMCTDNRKKYAFYRMCSGILVNPRGRSDPNCFSLPLMSRRITPMRLNCPS